MSPAVKPRPRARHRIAVIGAGAMGRRHVRVLAGLSARFETVGVLDVDPRAARDVSEEFRIAPLATEADVLAAADAVVVATPIAAHAATVRRALSSGRDVLVEKPVCGTIDEARALLDLAERTGRRLFVGHSERFNPVIRALARIVAPADVRALELRRLGGSARPPDHGVLLNLGVHDLDLVAYLTRSTLALRDALGDRGVAHVLVRTASGATGHVFADQRSGGRRRTIALTTPAHIFQGDLLAPSLVRICRATGVREAIPLDGAEPLALQALAFASALDGEVPDEIATGRDGARALLAAERAMLRIAGDGDAPRTAAEKLSASARS